MEHGAWGQCVRRRAPCQGIAGWATGQSPPADLPPRRRRRAGARGTGSIAPDTGHDAVPARSWLMAQSTQSTQIGEAAGTRRVPHEAAPPPSPSRRHAAHVNTFTSRARCELQPRSPVRYPSRRGYTVLRMLTAAVLHDVRGKRTAPRAQPPPAAECAQRAQAVGRNAQSCMPACLPHASCIVRRETALTARLVAISTNSAPPQRHSDARRATRP